jgi:hypothetical protein
MACTLDITSNKNPQHHDDTTHAQVSSGSFFIKRDQGRLAMAHLRHLAQSHSLHSLAMLLNALYPPPAVCALFFS